jgi:hypothetical protein
MRVLKVIYVMAIAALLIVLVIFGVEAFYPAPEHPDCYELLGPAPDYESPAYEEWEQQCGELYDEYRQEAGVHDRNVFFIVLPLGAVLAIAGTFLQRKSGVFGAGLILGGVGTMMFATVPYDLSMVLRFAGIAATLAVFIFMGMKVFLSLRRS